FFFSSRRRHTISDRDWSSDVCSSDLLVVKIAHEYTRAHKNLLDLVQEGNVGLLHAVGKFDPERGVKLSTYAAWWIRAYILRYLRSEERRVGKECRPMWSTIR